MRLYFCSSIFVVLAMLSGAANSYELATHGAITKAAVEQSVLNDAGFRADLGLPEQANPFGDIYLDVAGNEIRERGVSDTYEGLIIEDGLKVNPLSIKGWLMRGAIREDDLGQILGVNVGDDPHDDPYGSIFRVLNHFYDPAQNRPLTTVVGAWMRAPDWATGSINAFTQPNAPAPNRRNHFTVFDAREAMFRALTGRDVGGNIVASTEAERKEYWATTFRALGDVVHLVQDMGQPQHTRNDAHSGVPGFGHKSVFEEYIEIRATGAGSYKIDGTKMTPLPLTYEGYPIPSFTKYSDFWSTRNGVTGRGLADYSNRGFFSAGTNLGGNVYSLPSNNAANYVKESTTGLFPSISFLRGKVHDANLNTDASIRMTTESLFDAFLFSFKTYSLNRYNYDDMAAQLIPRAVAYSAGLINYFFRGRMEFKADPGNPGKYIISNLGTEDMKGTFTLYYDAKDGKRYPVSGDLAGETWVDRSIAAKGDLANLSFTPPVEPAPQSPGVYMLVFNGDMGEEEAVPGSTVGAVAATMVKPPSRIAFLRHIGPYTSATTDDIFVINADGSNERNITNKPGEYDDHVWSPDGTHIAFASNRGGTHEIYVLNVDSGMLVNVSNTPGDDSYPTWSRDGKRIAFQSLVPISGGSNSEILIANSDGTGLRNLTNTIDDVEWFPEWSPDGKSIIIDSWYDGLWGFALIDPENGSRKQLTISPPGKKHDYNPHFSRDSKRVVFNSDRDDYYEEIYIVGVGNTELVRMTNNPAKDWFPKWSPDGSKIVFVRSDGNDKIYTMNADGSGQTRISNPVNGVSDWNPSWSPDGDKILFQKHVGIYTMNPDGSNERFLTQGFLPLRSPFSNSGMIGTGQ